MSTTPKRSLAIRIATLTLAAGSLTALIVQASLSAGCNSSGATAVPSATPEPPQQAQPPMGTPASAAAATTTHPQPELQPGADYLPATKAGPVFHTTDEAKKLEEAMKAPPPKNANPALKPGADHFPATKSGFVFDPSDRPAPQPPAAQNNAPLQQQAPSQGKNR